MFVAASLSVQTTEHMLVKFHKTSTFGQNIGAINYLETI